MTDQAWPDWLLPAPPFTRAVLYEAIVMATSEAWAETRRTREEETFYAFGLYPAEDDLAIQSTASSEEGLRRVAPIVIHDGTLEERAAIMRWWDADWPYACTVLSSFDRVNGMLAALQAGTDHHLGIGTGSNYSRPEFERRWQVDVGPFVEGIVDLYIEALRQLDKDGVFAVQDQRVVLGIYGAAVERVPRTIRQLNPLDVAERVESEMIEGDALRDRLCNLPAS